MNDTPSAQALPRPRAESAKYLGIALAAAVSAAGPFVSERRRDDDRRHRALDRGALADDDAQLSAVTYAEWAARR